MKHLFYIAATLTTMTACTPAEPAGEMMPEVRVNITLTPEAKAELEKRSETIVVIGYFDGLANEDGMKVAYKTGTINWAPTERIEIKAGGQAIFKPRQLLTKTKKLIKDAPRITLNVVSGRKSDPNNLLNCNIYADSIENAAKKPVDLKCDLIR